MLISYHIIVIGCTQNLFLSGERTSHYISIRFSYISLLYIMLNTMRITTNQLEHIQTNLCFHLSYLEDQRNLKVYNKNIIQKNAQWSIEVYVIWEDRKSIRVFVHLHTQTPFFSGPLGIYKCYRYSPKYLTVSWRVRKGTLWLKDRKHGTIGQISIGLFTGEETYHDTWSVLAECNS